MGFSTGSIQFRIELSTVCKSSDQIDQTRARNLKTVYRFFVIICAFTLLSGSAAAISKTDLKEVANRVAPTFDDVHWLNPSEVVSNSLAGKVLLVNFWATWCPPCVEELPSIQNARDFFSQDDFEVIAVNAGETNQVIEEFLTTLPTPLTFPIVVDERLAVYADWQVRPLPTTFLVDRKGNIRYQAIGPRDFESDKIRDVIQSLIDE